MKAYLDILPHFFPFVNPFALFLEKAWHQPFCKKAGRKTFYVLRTSAFLKKNLAKGFLCAMHLRFSEEKLSKRLSMCDAPIQIISLYIDAY